MRRLSLSDKFCIHFDQMLKTLWGVSHTTERTYPGVAIVESPMSAHEKKHAAGLMRVNHSGEVCAQALYRAQALVSRQDAIRKKMLQASIEETDHLTWCHQRLLELGGHRSYLNPLWYAGSLMIGITAGMMGDAWSLGFLAETEQQVVHHLENHMKALPSKDQRSKIILETMQADEAHHRDQARHAGAIKLPWMIKGLMSLVSKGMVKISYWI